MTTLKALAVAAAVFAFTSSAQAGEFGETNSEKGCIILTLNTITRVEDTKSWMTSTGCAELKQSTARATRDDKGWFTCTLSMLMLHNRLRGRPDFDRPSLEVRRAVTQGCLMLMDDLSEDRAKYIASKGVN
jgi:hypothetical protein